MLFGQKFQIPLISDLSGASPGFVFDKSGSVPPGTYLLSGSNPSNITGPWIYLYEALIFYIFVSNQLSTTYSIDIIEHNKVTYNTVQTVTVTAAYGNKFYFPSGVSLTTDWELAVRVSSTSANSPKEIKVGMLILGEFTI